MYDIGLAVVCLLIFAVGGGCGVKGWEEIIIVTRSYHINNCKMCRQIKYNDTFCELFDDLSIL